MTESILIENQNKIIIKGAEKINSCTSTQAFVTVHEKEILLQGNNLEIKKLDLENKEVEISGDIYFLKYLNKKEKQPFLKRVFK